jgi:integrase
MITSYQVWKDVEKRAPGPRRQKLQSLLKFLEKIDNPHAMLLSDRIPHDACDQKSAESLEAWLVGALSSTVDKFTVAEWLRLCFDAIREFNAHGHDLYPTRLADLARPETSPFSGESIAKQRNVDAWRRELYKWIVEEDNKTPDDWLAVITISAVVHGFLLDAMRLDLFVKMLQRDELPVHEQEGTCVLFHLPFQGLGNHNTQRWFPDPITEMLVWQYAGLKNRPTNLKAEGLVASFLMPRIKPEFLPGNLGDFLSRMTTWWSLRAAPIDVYCAGRAIITHSINERSWARTHELAFVADLELNVETTEAESNLSGGFDVDDILLLNPWLGESISALKLQTKQEAKSAIDSLIGAEAKDGKAFIFMYWLSELLSDIGATKVALKISTISQRYRAAAPRLLAMLGDDDVRQLNIHELEDIYAELMSDPDPLVPRSALANGIREFHAYLHRHYRKPFITNESEVFGERLSLKPVDASIITFDEYAKAQKLLDKTRGNKRDIMASKIVLALGFKLGMRRMEIFGLLLSDLQLLSRPTCLVQKNPRRRIKTNSSRRVLPLRAFLDKAELSLLTEWIQTYRTQSASPGEAVEDDPHFFLGFTGDPDQFWTKKITAMAIDAMRKVTQDEQLYLHHLRHSFASWTYLRLRAPDFPNIHKHFEECPATVAALRTGRRLRVLLYNRDPGVSRTYAYAVARLLGHSSPMSSFGYYIHTSDLIIGAIAAREAARLPVGIKLAASGLQKSAAYENLQQSMDRLLAASRTKYMPAGARSSKVAAPARSRGRPSLAPAHETSAWMSLDLIQQVLVSAITDRDPVNAIASALELDADLINAILERAATYGTRIGINISSDGILSEIPLKVHKQSAARHFCIQLEKRLAEMSMRAPVLYAEGINLYLRHFDPVKKDVVFRGKKDLSALNKLLKFMDSLGCLEIEFSWVLRSIDTSCTTLPVWVKNIEMKWKPKLIKNIKPKKATSASSYAKWLGILPILPDGISIGLPVANIIFLASLNNKIIYKKSKAELSLKSDAP